jgi:hypothetical protein
MPPSAGSIKIWTEIELVTCGIIRSSRETPSPAYASFSLATPVWALLERWSRRER